MSTRGGHSRGGHPGAAHQAACLPWPPSSHLPTATARPPPHLPLQSPKMQLHLPYPLLQPAPSPAPTEPRDATPPPPVHTHCSSRPPPTPAPAPLLTVAARLNPKPYAHTVYSSWQHALTPNPIPTPQPYTPYSLWQHAEDHVPRVRLVLSPRHHTLPLVADRAVQRNRHTLGRDRQAVAAGGGGVGGGVNAETWKRG